MPEGALEARDYTLVRLGICFVTLRAGGHAFEIKEDARHTGEAAVRLVDTGGTGRRAGHAEPVQRDLFLIGRTGPCTLPQSRVQVQIL